MSKRTKILCTLGPAVDSDEAVEALIKAGMDLARLNFSHGSHAEHAARIERVKRLRSNLDSHTAILLDTKGSEVRTGKLKGGVPLDLQAGQELKLTPGTHEGDATCISQSYQALSQEVEPGDTILLDDGLIALTVRLIQGEDLTCRVENAGRLGERKSIVVPGKTLRLPALTETDKQDLQFGIEQDLDFVAASFVRDAQSVLEIKEYLAKEGGAHIPVLAKIECRCAIDNLEEIIQVADGLMIARGDLGVELPIYEVPHLQKKIIRLCNQAHKPVITATQMLESMVRNPRPTRAEVADVANAIYDGTDCIMLSGETAAGDFPVETCRIMARIAEETEQYLDQVSEGFDAPPSVSLTVGMSAVQAAERLGAACIVAPTQTGRSARLMSKLRPASPIIALAPDERKARQMQLYWGVSPYVTDVSGGVSQLIRNTRSFLLQQGLVEPGDICVYTVGDQQTCPQVVTEFETGVAIAPTNVMYIVQVHSLD